MGVAMEVPLMKASWKLLHEADAEDVLQSHWSNYRRPCIDEFHVLT